MPQLTEDEIKNYETRQLTRELAKAVNGRVTDLDDMGYDVVVVWGASNGVGWGSPIDPIENSAHPRVVQYATTGSKANTIYTAVDPLAHREIRSNNPGNVFTFCKQLAEVTPGSRKLLIVPCALGGTGWLDNRWNPGNDLYADTVTRANTVLALDPKNRIICFLNAAHGADATMTDPVYQAAYIATVNGFRTQISKASSYTPAITIGATDAALPLDGGIRQVKENLLASAAFANAVGNFIYVSGAGLASEGDNVHYTGASQNALGLRVFNKYISWLRQQD